MTSFLTVEFIALMTGLILSVLSYFPYVWMVLRRRIKPHLFSWFIWGFSTLIVLIAQIEKGAGIGAGIVAFNSFMCLFIAALSLKYGEKNIRRSDWIILAVSMLAIPVWLITHSPLYAVILLTAIDTIAMIPTLRKAWLKPYEESISMFALTALKFAVSLFALEQFNLTTALFPAVIALSNIIALAIILPRRMFWRHDPV